MTTDAEKDFFLARVGNLPKAINPPVGEIFCLLAFKNNTIGCWLNKASFNTAFADFNEEKARWVNGGVSYRRFVGFQLGRLEREGALAEYSSVAQVAAAFLHAEHIMVENRLITPTTFKTFCRLTCQIVTPPGTNYYDVNSILCKR